MAVITKGDLRYEYLWSTDKGDSPTYRGLLDGIKVDRDEGYEVLRFLNSFATTKAEALQAERLIKTKLPGHIQMRVDIAAWLRSNWSA